MTELVLSPTYDIDLVLTGDGSTLTISTNDSALVLALNPALRGEKGDTGVGILGVNQVTDQATIQIDLSAPYGVYVVTLAASRNLTFINGSVALDRKRFILEVTQGAGGNKTLTPDATVGFGADIPGIVLSTGAGITDALGFIYRHSAGKSHLLAVNRGA